jgi:hypothetical protein
MWCGLTANDSLAGDFTVTKQVSVPHGEVVYTHWFRYQDTILVMSGLDPLAVARRHQHQACGSRGYRPGPRDQITMLGGAGTQHGVPVWRYTGLCRALIVPR